MANVTIIPDNYDTLKAEYLILRKDLDAVNQELYGCKRQLKVAEALQHEYQSEIEILQSENNTQKQEFEEKIGQLEETVNNTRSKYNERVQILESELLKKDEEIGSLKTDIELIKKVNTSETPSEDVGKLIEEIVELKQEQETLLESEDELKLSLEILQLNNFALEETLTVNIKLFDLVLCK
ncbi:hypothetical protein NQ314_012652 [Rhamnusium bicolor]|uniref:Uncharacterized protein n=1 Tax=Rhamnusium bicolor TaxID=1586634 RepID=A0AAV8XBG2_9CUCU|nr:hypothetical protein NQ314_012652 [Rhamnusium bicolor]